MSCGRRDVREPTPGALKQGWGRLAKRQREKGSTLPSPRKETLGPNKQELVGHYQEWNGHWSGVKT